MLKCIQPRRPHSVVDKINSDTGILSFLVVMTMLNTILVPIFAMLVISPQCLRYIFITPDPVTIQHKIPLCSDFEFSGSPNVSALSVTCIGYEDTFQTSQFIPPYEYTYHCSYDVLSSYSSVSMISNDFNFLL